MASPRFIPIVPRRDPFAEFPSRLRQGVLRLRNFGVRVQNRVQTYPPAQTMYRRTGDLGRRWRLAGPVPRGTEIVLLLANNSDHAVWVQGPNKGSGPKQRELFARLGWVSITDVMDAEWPRARAEIRAALAGR